MFSQIKYLLLYININIDIDRKGHTINRVDSLKILNLEVIIGVYQYWKMPRQGSNFVKALNI